MSDVLFKFFKRTPKAVTNPDFENQAVLFARMNRMLQHHAQTTVATEVLTNQNKAA